MSVNSSSDLDNIDDRNQNLRFIVNLQKLTEKHSRLTNPLFKEFLAELFGTYILLSFGLASEAQLKFFTANPNNPYQTSKLTANLSFGFGVMIAILVVGKVSGCHTNPAVLFAMFLTGRLSFLKLIVYIVGQFCGAFLASFVVYLVYLDALKAYKFGMHSLDTAGIFATYPNEELSILGAFFDQVIGSSLLVIAVLAINDQRNVIMPHGVNAILNGIVVILIGMSYAYNCGGAINPARDFGPRFFTFIAGWGSQVFSAGNYFFWVPLVAPLFGSLLATFLYLLLISNHL